MFFTTPVYDTACSATGATSIAYMERGRERRRVVRAQGASGRPSLRVLLRQPPVKIHNYNQRGFMCMAEVKRLLTENTISAWIKTHPLHRYSDGHVNDQDWVGKIVDNCFLLFAILVDAELEFLTFTLLSKGNSDESLTKIDYSTLELNRDEQQRLTERCESYCPVLRKGEHLELFAKTVLPFTRRVPLQGKSGAYGQIFRIEVAEGHLEGYDKGTAAEKTQRLDNPEDEERYHREIGTLREREHPNIVPLSASYTLEEMDSGSAMRSLHFITPLAQMDLAEWMVHPEPPLWLQGLGRSETRGFLYRSIYALVSALSFLHREKEGKIAAHHDLKPKNILVFGQDLMIADFGSSHLRPLAEGSETQRIPLGTYEYHPPEYWKDDGSQARLKHGRAFDIWSMGCIIIELATLLVHGWDSKKLSDFRDQRRQNPPETRPKVTHRGDDDCSFHNNLVVVKRWVYQLQADDGSQKLKSTLDLALQMMNETPESRLYAWEAELDLYNIQRPDDPLVTRLEDGSLCVQSPPQKHIPNRTQTPLHRAALKGDHERINELLDVGWPLNIRNQKGLTAWEILKQTQDSDFCENLSPRLAPTTSEKPANEEEGQDEVDQKQAIQPRGSEEDKALATIVRRQGGNHSEGLDVEYRQITTWLSPVNFWARQQDIINNRTKDTGSWLLESTEYQSWRVGSGNILWCHGIPGAGKTVLASVVVEDLKRASAEENRAFAFLYCNYKERAQQTFQNLISSLTRQLIQHSRTIPSELRRLYQGSLDKQTRPSRQELLGLLTTVGSKFSSLYIVIDALDECDDTEEIRSCLVSSLCEALPRACFLVTSRLVPDIEVQFEDHPRLEIKATNEDIERYVSGQILHKPTLKRHIKADPNLRALMIETICLRSEGMFLLVSLHMTSLATKTTRKALLCALESLPAELDKTYDEALQRIRGQKEEFVSLAEDVLLWVVFAVEPLTIVELQHAIAPASLGGKIDIGDEDLTDPETLLDVCGGIVVVDEKSNLVRLVHYTTQKYFDRHPSHPLPVAQGRIAKTCIIYLSLALSNCVDFDFDDFDIRSGWRERYPFLYYAALHWGKHARGVPEDDCRVQILELISQDNVQAITDVLSLDSTQMWTLQKLAYAAALGLTSIVNHLLNEGVDVNQTGISGITALISAAGAGYVDTVRALLAADADINKADKQGTTALTSAASAGYIDTVRALLAADADVNKADKQGTTALISAAGAAHVDTVRALLAAGAQTDLRKCYTSALLEAASQGHDEVVQILLDHEANIEAVGAFGRTSLLQAAKGGFTSTVQLLIDKGANTNAYDALLNAAIRSESRAMVELVVNKIMEGDHMENLPAYMLVRLSKGGELTAASFDLLLEKGADPTSAIDGETPIHVAARYGNVESVRSLFKHGVSPNIKDEDGNTPIHGAAFSGKHEVIQILVDHGADLTAQNNAGLSGLHTFLHSGFDDRWKPTLVLLLGRRGVLVNTPDAEGETALHIAAHKAVGLTTFEFLMEHGADGSRKDHWGRTPLQIAAVPDNGKFIEQMLERQAITFPAHITRLPASTRLRNAVKNRDIVVIHEMLKIPDIDVNLPDDRGRTCLHFAASYGQKKIVESLLERGALVNARTYPNRMGDSRVITGKDNWATPLHIAAGRGVANTVGLLLKHGADLHATNDYGYKAFYIAAQGGHAHVMKVLFEHGSEVSESPEGRGLALLTNVKREYKDVIRLLLENGANAERDTDWGKKALEWARAGGKHEIVELLEKYGFTTPEE